MNNLLIPSAYADTECQANISSNPSGADVYIDGRLMGQTPYFHFVGAPFTMNLTIKMDGFEVWNEVIVVQSYEHKEVKAVLIPLVESNRTVTTTLNNTITSTRTITITTTMTTTNTQAATTTSVTVTSTSTATTTLVTTSERLSTITTKITEQVGMPVEFTYGAISVAVIAVIISIIIAIRKRS